MGLPPRRDLPVFKEAKGKDALKINPPTLCQKLADLGAAMELDPTKVVDTESERSGTNYSETERGVLRREGIGAADEDDEDDEDEDEESADKTIAPATRRGKARDGGDDASDLGAGEEGAASKKKGKSKGKIAAKGDHSKGKEKAGTNERRSNNNSKEKKISESNEGKSNNKAKGKEKAGVNEGKSEAGGRPSAEQLECVKELREAIDERVEEIAAKFTSSRESILRQLGLGVWKDVRKMSLWNMFTQLKSVEGARDDVKGCE